MSNLIVSDGQSASESERNILLITYVLHLVAPFTAFTAAIVSIIISHIKAEETQNAFIRSHHRYLIQTFWWVLGLGIVFGLLCLIFIGFPLLFALWVWWIYRLIRGVLAFADRRDMELKVP